MKEKNDEQLIREIAKGGKKADLACQEIYQRYATKIKSYLLGMGVSQDSVADIFHEACMKLMASPNKFKGGSVLAWLYTIAGNTAKDMWRKTNRMTLNDPDDFADLASPSTPLDEITTKDFEECIKLQWTKFREKFPNAYLAIDLQLDGLKINEISPLIGRTAAATKEFLSQAKKKLQSFLQRCDELRPNSYV